MNSQVPEPAAESDGRDTDAAPVEPPSPQDQAPVQNKAGSGGVAAALSLAVVALGLSAAVALFGWWRVYEPLGDAVRQVGEQAPRLAQLEDELAGLRRSLEAGREGLAAQFEDETAALDVRLDDIAATQGALREEVQRQADWREEIDATLDGLRRYLGQTRRDWLLNEAEYLLVIANRRLLLEGDVGTAIAALQFADDSLRELNHSRWLPVRRQIADELRALRAVESLDVEGTDLAIGSLAESVASLPLSGFQRSVATTAPAAGGGWWNRMRTALEGIVNIQRVDEPPQPLLPPGQRFFLSQNLALHLEAARFALLHDNGDLYRARLEQADALLARYFETGSAAVQAARQEIARWLELPVGRPLPRIGAALSQLRGIRQAHAVIDEAPTP